MNKITNFILISLLIIGCKPNTEEKENIDLTDDLENSMENDQELSEPEDIPVDQKELVFNTIEDYAQLTSKEELTNTFGKENIKNGTSWYAEGTVEMKHTIVTNLKNKHIVKYLWDEENPKKLNSIEVGYFDYDENYEIRGTQKILSNCGFYTGMPINDLRKWNGADFNFSGFGWDYEGGVFVMPKSRLSNCPVTIKLGLKNQDYSEDYDDLFGDQELSTSNELVKNAPIIIDRLYYYIDK